jgi:membrane-associated protein
MRYRRFAVYNVAGGLAWVAIFLCGGYLLSSFETVKRNFHLIIFAIILISVLPAVIEVFLARRRQEPAPAEPVRVEQNGDVIDDHAPLHPR